MRITLSAALARKYLKKHPNSRLDSSSIYLSEEKRFRFQFDDPTEEQLGTLEELAWEDKDLGPAILKNIKSHRAIIRGASGHKIKRLEQLATALKHYLKDVPNHWLVQERNDGLMLPYFVEEIKYHPARKSRDYETPAYVNMTLKYMWRGDSRSTSFSWHKSEAIGRTVEQILAEESLNVATPELIAIYEQTMERYKALQAQTGAQFIARGEAYLVDEEYRYRSTSTSLVQEGVPDKLVMDDQSEEGGKFSDDSPIANNHFWQSFGDEEEEEEDPELTEGE